MYPSSGQGSQRRGGGNPPGPSVGQMRSQPGMGTGNPNRISEVLDQAKLEFEAILQQMSMHKVERDEFERQLQAQLQEMEQIQQTLKTLETTHRRVRQQYEEDVLRLRRQLEGQSGQVQHVSSKPTKRGRPVVEENERVQVPSSNTGPRIPGRAASPVRVANAPPPRAQQIPHSQHSSQHSHLPQHVPSSSGIVSEADRQIPPRRHPPATMGSLPVENDPADHQRQAKMERDGTMRSISERQDHPDMKSLSGSISVGTAGNGTGQPVSLNSISSSMNPPAMKKAKINGSDSHGAVDEQSTTNNSDRAEEVSNRDEQDQGNIPNVAPSTTGGNTNSSSANNASTVGGGKAKVKWTITYNTKASSYPEKERPHVEMQHTLDHQSVVCCVRFSADGSMMASGCHKTAQVFDVKSGQQIFSVSRPPMQPAPDGEDAYVRAVCFSPDGKKLVAGMPQHTIRMWDIETKEEGKSFSGHESEIYSLDYVNNLIASGSGDRKVRLWDATTGNCHAIYGNEKTGPVDGVTSVAISPDGRLIAAASLDKVVRIWDTSTTQLLDRLEGHSDSVYSIAFSPDGKNVISGSLDKTLMLWDVSASGHTTTRPRLLFQGHKDFVLSVAYTPDGRWLMSGSKDRTVVFWDPRSTRSVLTLSGYRNSVISVASSPASPHFATGSGDCFACLWKYQCQSI